MYQDESLVITGIELVFTDYIKKVRQKQPIPEFSLDDEIEVEQLVQID